MKETRNASRDASGIEEKRVLDQNKVSAKKSGFCEVSRLREGRVDGLQLGWLRRLFQKKYVKMLRTMNAYDQGQLDVCRAAWAAYEGNCAAEAPGLSVCAQDGK